MPTATPAHPPENNVLFYTALRKADVPAGMRIQRGPHGVVLGRLHEALSSWSARLAN